MKSIKICMVGAFAVGKTSLVRRYVHSLFNEKYHTTIGVKIDKAKLLIDDEAIQLIIWDIEGVDVFTGLNLTYLRGASGVLLVIDGTRDKTVESAQQILRQVRKTLPDAKVVLVINKSDLESQWALTSTQLDLFEIDDDNIFYTSAKTGESVEQAFIRIAELSTNPSIVS